MKQALAGGDRKAAKDAVDDMWTALYATFRSLRELELAWNELTFLFADEQEA